MLTTQAICDLVCVKKNEFANHRLVKHSIGMWRSQVWQQMSLLSHRCRHMATLAKSEVNKHRLDILGLCETDAIRVE